ncbi:hypothetical protein HYY69_07955 [Candidatus Woesearchaeota archaeon]|nr:hypothetical protein [Candidatus Woesearchaeota archaeon]
MKTTLYYLSAIALIVLTVSLFAKANNQSITGNSIYDNPALFSNRCETYYDNSLLFGGTIYHNYCYVNKNDLKEYLHKYECFAGHMMTRDVDCQASGKVCSKNRCIRPPKTRKYTNS